LYEDDFFQPAALPLNSSPRLLSSFSATPAIFFPFAYTNFWIGKGTKKITSVVLLSFAPKSPKGDF
jgi:hypothetical protein